jgi:hypothetical protein
VGADVTLEMDVGVLSLSNEIRLASAISLRVSSAICWEISCRDSDMGDNLKN